MKNSKPLPPAMRQMPTAGVSGGLSALSSKAIPLPAPPPPTDGDNVSKAGIIRRSTRLAAMMQVNNGTGSPLEAKPTPKLEVPKKSRVVLTGGTKVRPSAKGGKVADKTVNSNNVNVSVSEISNGIASMAIGNGNIQFSAGAAVAGSSSSTARFQNDTNNNVRKQQVASTSAGPSTPRLPEPTTKPPLQIKMEENTANAQNIPPEPTDNPNPTGLDSQTLWTYNSPTFPLPTPTPPPAAYQPRPSMVLATTSVMKNFEPTACQFCTISLKIDEGLMLQDCLHVLCRDCLRSTIELQDKEHCKIACPLQCGGYLQDAEVKDLVSPQLYQEYLDRSLIIAKKKMKNVFSCKSQGCTSWCEFEEGRKIFVCPQCKQENCMICQAIHVGVDCTTYQKLLENGELHKLKDMMDKERKNSGFEQLAAAGNNGTGMDMDTEFQNTDLLQNMGEFECSICFGDVAPGEGVILHECLHIFCKECLINLVDHNDEPVVKCPYIDGNYSCVCQLQPREIKALVPPNVYEKHLQQSVKLGESSIENSYHCKTPDCQGWVVSDQGATRFECPVCKKWNCITCKAIHEDSCEDYKNRIKQNENDKLSEEALEKLIKKGEYMRCPKCRILVQKTVGCDWLVCSACKTEICWVTRGPRWGPKGRGDITGGCRCKVNGKPCHPKCGNCH